MTRNSEKNGSLVRFSIPKACSRPNWRRKPRCQSKGERSAGAWVRETLGSFFGWSRISGFRASISSKASVQKRFLARHRSGIPRRIGGSRGLSAVPILKPEPADANELPRIVSYDPESAPQGTSRKQQVIGSDGRTLAVQACPQLRRHSRISDGQPGLPSVFLSSHSRSALRINPLRVSPSFLAVRSNSLAV